MSDGVEGEKLEYGGKVVGFVRVPKSVSPRRISRDYIALTRGRTESDESFLSRILDAEEQERRKPFLRINSRQKYLSPSLEMTKSALLECVQSSILTRAGKLMDDAVFDQSLKDLSKAELTLARYYAFEDVNSRRRKATKENLSPAALDVRADLLLRQMMLLPNPVLNPSHDDEQAYNKFARTAQYIYSHVMPKTPQTLHDYIDVLNERKEKGLGHISRFFDVSFAVKDRLSAYRAIWDNEDVPFLSYGSPHAVLELAIDRDAPFLHSVLGEVYEVIKKWAQPRNSGDHDTTLTDIYTNKAFSNGAGFAAFVMEKTKMAIEQNHPQSALIRDARKKLEDLAKKQMSALEAARVRAEEQLKTSEKAIDVANKIWGCDL